jgi:hypothetical protein
MIQNINILHYKYELRPSTWVKIQEQLPKDKVDAFGRNGKCCSMVGTMIMK